MQRKVLVIPLLAGLLAVGACGGNKSGADAGANPKVVDDATADKNADAAAGTDVNTNFSGKGGKDFCSYLKEQTERDLSIDGTEPPAEQQKKAKETVHVLNEFIAKAPPEISADVKLAVETTKLYFIALGDGKQLTPEQEAALQGTPEQVKARDAATARINAYGEKVCGVKTENSSGTASTSPESTVAESTPTTGG